MNHPLFFYFNIFYNFCCTFHLLLDCLHLHKLLDEMLLQSHCKTSILKKKKKKSSYYKYYKNLEKPTMHYWQDSPVIIACLGELRQHSSGETARLDFPVVSVFETGVAGGLSHY